MGSLWDHFEMNLDSRWGHSLTLRVVAVDPNTSQPCVTVSGTSLPRAKKARAELAFGDCGGHDNGGGDGGGGGGDGDGGGGGCGGGGRRFAPSADGASRRRLGGLRPRDFCAKP